MSEYGTGPGQVHPGMPDDLERPETTEPVYGDTPREADLFTMTPKACAQELVRRWQVQDRQYGRRMVEWKVNQRRLCGDVNVWAVKEQDINSWRVYTPPGASAQPVAVFNKANRLCDRFTSNVWADAPKLEAEVPPNDAHGAAKARLATNILRDIDSEGRLNDLDAAREAFGRWGAVTGSGYVHYFVDPHAGGRQPMKIDAGPQAQTVDDATHDPMTGAPWPELAKRFVMPDGMLADEPAQAATRWEPGLTRDVLGAHHVRFEPQTALNLWDAEGVHVAGYYPWEQVLRWFPELVNTPPEEAERLSKVRPPKTHDLLPWEEGRPVDTPSDAKQRERMTYVQWTYYLQCPAYADGFAGVVVGDTMARKPQTWITEDGQPYDLPLTQYQQFGAPDGNPHGWGMMHLLGPSSEWRAELVGAMEDVLDRVRNRKTFIPTNSTLQGKHHLMQALSYIPINEGGEPKYEDVPTDALKPAADLFNIVTREMDDQSTMQEAGQGLQTSNVNSGRQAMAIQSQVSAGQSTVRQRCASALVRAGRIKLQLLKGITTTPQLVKWGGEGTDAIEDEWQAMDLKGITSVRLVPGSFEGLTSLQKADRAMMYGQAGLMPPDELTEVVQNAIGSTFGWKESPHMRHVRQQVAKWERAVRDLPPEAKLEPPPMQPVPVPPVPDPMTGMLIEQPPQMQPMAAPEAAAIFAPLLVDSEPRVAMLRVKVLGNAMVGDVYADAPPGWRLALDQAYQAAVMAAQPPAPMPGHPGQPPQDGGAEGQGAEEPERQAEAA